MLNVVSTAFQMSQLVSQPLRPTDFLLHTHLSSWFVSVLGVSHGACYSAMSMAQAWHKHREQLSLAQGAEAQWWRASKYELVKVDLPMPGMGRRMFPEICIEAASDARWERFTPF